MINACNTHQGTHTQIKLMGIEVQRSPCAVTRLKYKINLFFPSFCSLHVNSYLSKSVEWRKVCWYDLVFHLVSCSACVMLFICFDTVRSSYLLWYWIFGWLRTFFFPSLPFTLFTWLWLCHRSDSYIINWFLSSLSKNPYCVTSYQDMDRSSSLALAISKRSFVSPWQCLPPCRRQ